MTYLLDLNLLIALAWPNHVHHEAAHRWFGEGRRFATCPVTQLGFVRVSSNGAAIPSATTPQAARGVLSRIAELPGHVFWPDDLDYARAGADVSGHLMGPRQVTDAYLLGLAAKHEGRLATLDRRVRALVPGHSPLLAHLEVIEG